ncbi:MAG: hypothetical protein ABI616_00450 [Pseudomonadota bacterium]
MSPLWRDEIGIYIAPHKLALTRMGRGLRPKLVCEAGWTNDFHGDVHWNAALAALDRFLSLPEWKNAVVRVVLADNWVRYAVVNYSDSLTSEAERLAQARHVLTAIFGEVVSQWTIRLSDNAPGSNQVACGLPSALIEELGLVLARHKLPVLSMCPQLVAAYNHWRDRLPDGGAWFVSLEQGTLAAARLVPGGWDRVHSVRIGVDWPVELRRLQTFGRLASSAALEGRVYVDAPAGLSDAAGISGADLVWLVEGTSTESTNGKLEFLRRHQA